MNVQPHEFPHRELYRLLITSVAPRPIAWVSTISEDGIHNLAPFSFFNAICANPPLLSFCPGVRSRSSRKELGSSRKDTLRNVRATGEFVVNVVTFPLAEPMNLTSGEYEATVDEFEVARLSMRSSQLVRPPQVAESPVNFECKVFQILDFGTDSSGGSLVIGEIVSVHLEEAVLRDGRIDGQLLDLIGRMGGPQYCRTTERFDMARPERKPQQQEDIGKAHSH